MTFVCKGSLLRLHFNRHGAAPLVWSISTGEFEVSVKSFRVHGVAIETVYAPKATPDDEDGKPSAWLRPVQDVLVRVGVSPEGHACIDLPSMDANPAVST